MNVKIRITQRNSGSPKMDYLNADYLSFDKAFTHYSNVCRVLEIPCKYDGQKDYEGTNGIYDIILTIETQKQLSFFD